jgi:hypothetical protein
MFRGLSQCILYFGLFKTLPLLSFTCFPPTPHFSTAFTTYPYILYLDRCYVLQYCWCSVILFSFPSFPEFHRVVPLLQMCFIYEFVYASFCVYVYLLNLFSMYWFFENNIKWISRNMKAIKMSNCYKSF